MDINVSTIVQTRARNFEMDRAPLERDRSSDHSLGDRVFICV